MTMARAQQLDTPRLKDADLQVEESMDGGARFGGGVVPAVRDGSHFGGGYGGRSASEMAYLQVAAAGGQEEDPRVKELKAKVKALVKAKFNEDYRAGFAHYDSSKDGGLDKEEIKNLLADAGVGNGLTRGAWANGIIEKLDKSGDKKVQWAEFDAVFSDGAQRA